MHSVPELRARAQHPYEHSPQIPFVAHQTQVGLARVAAPGTSAQRACQGQATVDTATTSAASASDEHAGTVAPVAGLVHSQTSVTQGSDLIRVDPQATRLKRLKCSVITAARLHAEQKSRWKVAMITLTYAPENDWEPNQVSDCLRAIRQFLKRRAVEFRFVWVQEFTKKGRPHYHVLLWLPLGVTLPKPDKRGWWPYGMTKIEWARNAVGYIAKYASKGDSLHKPAKGARMHGNGGLTDFPLLEQRWWKLPGWAREVTKPADRCRRRVGGGLLMPETGEVLESPWEVYFKGGNVYIRRKEGQQALPL